MSDSNFWNDQENAKKLSQRLKFLNNEIEIINSLENEIKKLSENTEIQKIYDLEKN